MKHSLHIQKETMLEAITKKGPNRQKVTEMVNSIQREKVRITDSRTWRLQLWLTS